LAPRRPAPGTHGGAERLAPRQANWRVASRRAPRPLVSIRPVPSIKTRTALRGTLPMDPYDPRYLAGVLLFNAHDFFEAHEVWEDLWAESHGPQRRFYQGLIQAAVGLCHFNNGNLGGAPKLYPSRPHYMDRPAEPLLGRHLPAL